METDRAQHRIGTIQIPCLVEFVGDFVRDVGAKRIHDRDSGSRCGHTSIAIIGDDRISDLDGCLTTTGKDLNANSDVTGDRSVANIQLSNMACRSLQEHGPEARR